MISLTAQDKRSSFESTADHPIPRSWLSQLRPSQDYGPPDRGWNVEEATGDRAVASRLYNEHKGSLGSLGAGLSSEPSCPQNALYGYGSRARLQLSD